VLIGVLSALLCPNWGARCGREEDVALWAEMFNHSIRWSNGINGENKPGMMIESVILLLLFDFVVII